MKQLSLIIFVIALSARCDQLFDYAPLTGFNQVTESDKNQDVLSFYGAKDQIDDTFTPTSSSNDRRIEELVESMNPFYEGDPFDVDLSQAALDGDVIPPEYYAKSHAPVNNNQNVPSFNTRYPTYSSGTTQLPTGTNIFDTAIADNLQETFGIDPDPTSTVNMIGSVPANVIRAWLAQHVDPSIEQISAFVSSLRSYTKEQKEELEKRLIKYTNQKN